MADITKCSNEICESKNKCVRYLIEANPRYQSYAYFECNEENDWEDMIKIEME